ncbi:MAG: hypothetical protein AAF828_04500 [Bacteroidota bacterium]
MKQKVTTFLFILACWVGYSFEMYGQAVSHLNIPVSTTAKNPDFVRADGQGNCKVSISRRAIIKREEFSHRLPLYDGMGLPQSALDTISLGVTYKAENRWEEKKVLPNSTVLCYVEGEDPIMQAYVTVRDTLQPAYFTWTTIHEKRTTYLVRDTSYFEAAPCNYRLKDADALTDLLITEGLLPKRKKYSLRKEDDKILINDAINQYALKYQLPYANARPHYAEPYLSVVILDHLGLTYDQKKKRYVKKQRKLLPSKP